MMKEDVGLDSPDCTLKALHSINQYNPIAQLRALPAGHELLHSLISFLHLTCK